MADAAEVLDEVKGVGAGTRTAVLERYPDLQDLALAEEDDLTAIRGVGPATARAIKDAVSSALEAEATADVADPDEVTPDSPVAVRTSAPEPPAGSDTPEEPSSPGAALPGAGTTSGADRGGDPQRGGGPQQRAREDATPAAERLRRDLDETVRAVRDAAFAMGGVILAALTAGREQLPEVKHNLRDATESLSRTVADLLGAVKGERDGRS